MHASRLFEAERIRLATAVMWWYEVEGGTFHYWPDGPEQPGRSQDPSEPDVAVLGDNELLYHGVAPHGPANSEFLEGLSLESTLQPDRDHPGTWTICTRAEEHLRLDASQLRVTMSWKAEVFATTAEADAADAGQGRLTLEAAVDRICRDLTARGRPVAPPDDPLTDEAFHRAAAETYHRPAPRVPVT